VVALVSILVAGYLGGLVQFVLARGAVALAVTIQPLRRYCRFPEPSFVAFVEAGFRGPQEPVSPAESEKTHGGTTMRVMILAQCGLDRRVRRTADPRARARAVERRKQNRTSLSNTSGDLALRLGALLPDEGRRRADSLAGP